MGQAERIRAIAEADFGPQNPRHRDLVHYGWHLCPDVPEKKLVGATEAYARFDFRDETPLLLFDDTVFGSGKRGLLVTSQALHFCVTDPRDGISDYKGRLALAAIRSLRVVGDAIYVNENKLGTITHQPEAAVLAIESFFRRVAEALAAPAEPTALRVDLLRDVARRCLGPGSPLHGSLRHAGWFVCEDIPEAKLQHAREAYAPYDPAAETPVMLYDLTIFGSAKRGMLLTSAALYWSMTSTMDGFSEVKGRMPLGGIKRLTLEGAEVHLNDEPIGRIVKQDRRDHEAVSGFFRQIVAEPQGLAPELARGASVRQRQSPDEVFALIRGLKALYEEGALTEDEFMAKKQELLQRL